MNLKPGDKVSYRWMVRDRKQYDMEAIYNVDNGVVLALSESSRMASVKFSRGLKTGIKWVHVNKLTKEEK